MVLYLTASGIAGPKNETTGEDPPPAGHYLFYRSSGDQAREEPLAPPYVASAWRPSFGRPWPAGASDSRDRLRFLFRYLVHYLRLFANRECGAICVYFDNRLVHYSGFTPRYWRFPFMGDDDIQIGNTWTDPVHRGKGLAFFALEKILVMKRKPGRYFWYCVEAINRPSIRVATRAGFELAAEGTWKKPFGIKLIGSYVITSKKQHDGAALSHAGGTSE